ncbi:MAG: DNA mismatch repair endonuclease MutL [Desulfohalobiaceae bacterium]|nr:DNA mismatch repair endonuclease MutL [Desulfohalobiaceae bacterium]
MNSKIKREIKILPPELQNQIAAGEVVERPASVLKELVENSLDAGADRIEVNIEAGGQGLISVQDNGHGLGSRETELALTRHATSKIVSARDLSLIDSFGFRGEALPSIASVSRVHFSSCPGPEPEGTKLEVEFGRILEKRPISLKKGSKIEVRDLFVNTPARLKFLKTRNTEFKKCQEVVQRFALAHLKVEFSFVSGGRRVLSFPRKQSLLERLGLIWPEKIQQGLLDVCFEQPQGFRIQGVVGSPDSAQARGGRILFFVNNRPVQDKLLLSGLRQAYKGKLLSREYPQAVLFLDIPAAEVDVNVHPAKSEVRFRDEQAVFSLIRNGVLQALQDKEGKQYSRGPESSQAFFASRTGFSSPKYQFRSFSDLSGATLREETEAGPAFSDPGRLKESGSNLQESRFQKDEGQWSAAGLDSVSGYDYLGQIYLSYLLLRDKSRGLLILDQHAAHERVLFEQYKGTGESSPRQNLALPIEKRLHRSEQAALEKSAPLLRRLGFSFERPGKERILIRTVPTSLDLKQAKSFLDSVLTEQLETLDQIWCLMACRQAVKAGEQLAREEALQLISAWQACRDKEHCPHGRPALVGLEYGQLEKMFKR